MAAVTDAEVAELLEQHSVLNALLMAHILLQQVPMWHRPPGTQRLLDTVDALMKQRAARLSVHGAA